MTDFVRAIREHPEDDSVRLVYADWLQERGDPRGELVTLQCEIARLPELDPRRLRLEARARSLWPERLAWRKRLEQLGADLFVFELERGFYPIARIEPGRLCDGSADQIFAIEPITGLYLDHALDDVTLEDLAHWEGMTLIRDLRLSTSVSNSAPLAMFLGSARLGGLRRLNIERAVLGAETTEVLVHAVPELRQLYLENVDQLGLGALPGLPRLKALRLVGSGLSERVIEALGKAPWQLQELLVWGCQIFNDSAAEALAKATWLPGVERLRIGSSPIGNRGIAALAATKLPAIEELGLVSVGGEGSFVASLAEAGILRRVRRLNLGHNRISQADLKTLLAAVSPELRELELPAIHLNVEAVRLLAECENLRHLVRLDLTGWVLEDQGAQLLAGSPHLADLEVLRIFAGPARVWRGSKGQLALSARFGMGVEGFPVAR